MPMLYQRLQRLFKLDAEVISKSATSFVSFNECSPLKGTLSPMNIVFVLWRQEVVKVFDHSSRQRKNVEVGKF